MCPVDKFVYKYDQNTYDAFNEKITIADPDKNK